MRNAPRRLNTGLMVLGVVMALSACVPGGSNRPAPAIPVAVAGVGLAAAAAAPVAPNPWGDETRSLLAPQCGSCHLPNLPTSKPPALAVFNFIEEPWYGRMSAEQIVELGRRVQGSKTMSAPDKEKVAAFVRCATGGSCANP